MSVERPFDIYREQLTSQYHGVALWRPNPVENVHDQVSIGVKAGLPAVTDEFPSSSSSEPHRAVRTSPKSPGTSRFPPSLTAQDKAKFTQYFSKYSPVDGLLLGEKAREVFAKSKLPVEQLSQIWNLSDTQNRGSLDVADFIVAMYLIQASMSGQLPVIPTTLPPGLYEMASGRQTLPGSAVASYTTGSSGSFSSGFPGSFSGSGIVQPQLTGKQLQPQYSGRPLQSQFTGQVARNVPALAPFPAVAAPHPQPAWDVTPTVKATADMHFDGLDKQKRGYIESDVVVPFMLRSKLREDVLASIWDLADLNNDGRITRDGFAVAFHLIRGKLTGKEVPTTLPASLMPPSMRVVVVPTASPFQQSQPTTLQPQRTVHSRISAISAPQTQGFASNKDLLDDDDDDARAGASTTINDLFAEIGNLRTATRSLENARAEQNNVEVTVQNQAAHLSALQTQLGSAKAAYGAESRLLATLRERFSNQLSEIQKVKEELIRAESELSAIRLERAEVEQNLLHDKEEIRDLQRKMTETGSTIEVVKAEIENAKKEAKQQKGLLIIAKKQHSTRETERTKISQELQEAVAEVEEATREREMTEAELLKEPMVSNGLPFAPSPSLSGDSVPFSAAQPHPGSFSGSLTAKSNNPFERIAGSGRRSPFLPSSVPTPAAVTSAQTEGTTTDNPVMFDRALGDEEARPGPDIEAPSTGPERNVQLSTGKIAGKPGIAVSEAVSEPFSDHGPPTSALGALGANAITSVAEPDSLKLAPPDATSPVPSIDRPPDVPTDINSQLKVGTAKEVVSNGHSSPQTTVEAAFPPVVAVGVVADAQSTNPFLRLSAKDKSPFPASTLPFAVSPLEPPKVATSSDFDKAFGDFPVTARTAGEKKSSFDNAFEDQFDFIKAKPSSSSLPAIDMSSSGSAAFPPAPTSSGISISPIRETVFENAFRPPQKAASSARPMSAVDGLPVLPSVPESQPFSFDQVFSSDLSSSVPTTTAAPTHATPSQRPPVADAPKSSFFDDDSGFGSSSSRLASPRDPVLSPPEGPSRSSSKKSQRRYSILNIRLPFGKKKSTQESLPPSQHDRTSVENDVEPVKQLYGMGFSRTQAITALEANSYDFQKALNSLLSA